MPPNLYVVFASVCYWPRVRVACPACESAFEAPDASLTAGRVLRCGLCQHRWVYASSAEAENPAGSEPQSAPRPDPPAVSQAPPPQPPESPPAEPTPAPPASPPSAAPAGTLRFQLACAASLLCWLGVVGAGLALHRPIAHLWPAAQRLYTAMGLSR